MAPWIYGQPLTISVLADLGSMTYLNMACYGVSARRGDGRS